MTEPSKFTPGPWTVQDEPGCCFHEGNHYAITQEGEDQGESWWATIAEIWPTCSDNGEADARLIAAAPKMYELLDKLADRTRGVDAVLDIGRSTWCALCQEASQIKAAVDGE